ncbi:glycosyltransferase family 2 protein [Chromatocurvus halotolerans]|nr:glycosyltransferase [Chromatocurvus halotolerans]
MPHHIDVIIPCYNCGQFLETTLESIHAQAGEFSICDIFIVNDRSADQRTIDLLYQLKLKGQVRILENDGKKGAASARNTGLRESRSEWIIFLDGDDILQPGSIQARIDVLKSHPAIEWIGGDITLMDEAGTKEREGFFSSRPRTRQVLQPAWSSQHATIFVRPVEMFAKACLTQVGASLISRRLIEEVGGFNENLWQAEDYQLWLKLANVADFAFIPRSLLLYRQHDGSTMATDSPPRKWTIQAFQELESDPYFSQINWLLKQRISQFYTENAWYFVLKHQFLAAANSYFHAFLYRPNMRSVVEIMKLVPRAFVSTKSRLQ